MSCLIQDSVLGQFIRLVSRGRYFRFEEQKDPSLWQQYINLDKSGRMAYTGRPDADEVPEPERFSAADTESMTRVPSTAWSHNGRRYQGITGAAIDPEKGRDVTIIDCGADTVDPQQVLDVCAEQGRRRVLCEGGPTLFGSFITAGLVDELCLTTSPHLVAGSAGRIAHDLGAGALEPIRAETILTDDDGFMYTRWVRPGRTTG